MLTYILAVASFFLAVSALYFIKSRNKTEAIDMESTDDDASIYPLEKNIEENRRKLQSYDDGTYLKCLIHVRKGEDFPFDHTNKECRKRVTIYDCSDTKEHLLDIFNTLNKDDLIFIEGLQQVDSLPIE